MIMINAKYILNMKIFANNAEAGPPLGTVLGNLGVNTSKFCKEFNDFTKTLPTYFQLIVRISIFENRSFSFLVFLPSTGFLISLLKFNKLLLRRKGNFLEKKTYNCIKLYDAIQLAFLKFPLLPLKQSFPIIYGSIKSSGLILIDN